MGTAVSSRLLCKGVSYDILNRRGVDSRAIVCRQWDTLVGSMFNGDGL